MNDADNFRLRALGVSPPPYLGTTTATTDADDPTVRVPYSIYSQMQQDIVDARRQRDRAIEAAQNWCKCSQEQARIIRWYEWGSAVLLLGALAGIAYWARVCL